MRNNLYLFTDYYPFGLGEKTFVIPELEALIEQYNVTIVSRADKEWLSREECTSPLPEGVGLLHWNKPGIVMRLLYSIGFLFSKVCWKELWSICSDGFAIGRLMDSVNEYAKARSFLRYCVSLGVFSDVDNSVFYAFWFSTQCLMLSMAKAKYPQIVLLSRIHGYELHAHVNDHGRQPFQLFKKANCDRIIFASETGEVYFDKHYGGEYFEGQYFLNRLGVADRGLNPELRGREIPLLVSCSNVIPIKRVDLIARSVAALGDEIRWVHFGDGSCLESIKSYCEDKRMRVQLRGHVSNEAVTRFYQDNHVDAFIQLSEDEGGCPVAIQEALSFGIPIIGTSCGGITETIDGNGILLPKNPTIDEVVEALKSICFASPSRLEAMRRRSRIIWESDFNVQENKIRLIDELGSIVSV